MISIWFGTLQTRGGWAGRVDPSPGWSHILCSVPSPGSCLLFCPGLRCPAPLCSWQVRGGWRTALPSLASLKHTPIRPPELGPVTTGSRGLELGCGPHSRASSASEVPSLPESSERGWGRVRVAATTGSQDPGDRPRPAQLVIRPRSCQEWARSEPRCPLLEVCADGLRA